MKHLFLLVSSVLILCTTALIAQNSNTVDTDKKQILKTVEQWCQQVIIDGNLNAIKDFYPKSGVTLYYSNQKIEEETVEEIIKSMSSQSDQGKYTSYNILDDPYIYITDDGVIAFISYTVEFGYEDLKTKKKNMFSTTGMEVLKKEDGKWVQILGMEESVKEERKVVVVDKNILGEYNGTYKSEKSGNVYTVTNDGKNLIWTTKEGKQFILKPQSEYSFFMEGKSQSIIFGRDKKGNISFYTYIKNNVCAVANKVK